MITLVLPLVAQHDQYVSDVLKRLGDDTSYVSQVVLARSGLSKRDLETYLRWASELSVDSGLKVTVSALSRHATAGENRNRGWGYSTSRFTAFVDADDTYMPGRLGLLLQVAEQFDASMVLHDHFYSDEAPYPFALSDFDPNSVVGPSELMAATFPGGRRRHLEGRIPGDTNIELPPGTEGLGRVGHGYAFVKTSLRDEIQYGLRYPGEDGQFCRDVLWNVGGVYYLPTPLATYRRELSAEYGASLRDKLSRRVRAIPELGLEALRR